MSEVTQEMLDEAHAMRRREYAADYPIIAAYPRLYDIAQLYNGLKKAIYVKTKPASVNLVAEIDRELKVIDRAIDGHKSTIAKVGQRTFDKSSYRAVYEGVLARRERLEYVKQAYITFFKLPVPVPADGSQTQGEPSNV